MMHLHARLRGWDVEIQGCKKSLYPWGSSSYPCAVFHIDCGNRQDGSGSDDDFVGLNHESLLVLLFFHCPALRVPRAIRNFPNLQGIGIHHSTLVSWDVNAAFDVTTQSQVAYVEFVLVNFSTFPQALVDAPLPQTLTDIEFTHTNLTTLPPNLHEAWPSMEVLYLEFSQLQEIPSTLLQMDLYWLSLTGNNISNVSIISQTPVSMASLNLDRNPFHELPETMANAVSFAILGAQRTNVDSVPAWATSEHLSGQLQMYGTPYCERESPSDSSVVTCAAHVVGVYPFDYVESFHATTDV
ncbi:TPA: hypothetical protein N0F65_000101 [Lagenidium giganteum]|uniref:Uncharacterized protein n=1 Tax=Lagenidium giganteum TaxID=4803 RepID=A0AAV2YUN4_9STRA|nr:TPA: hypothetical protein N0F65_000101 [Lagenidium giganteum]